MFRIKSSLILAILSVALLIQQNIFAATDKYADVPLNQIQQKAIIASLIEIIRNEYVEPGKAKAFVAALEASVKEGAYEQERLASSFINATNKLLHAVYPDKHLGVLTAERFALMQTRFKSEPETHTKPEAHAKPEQHQPEQHQPNQHSAGHASSSKKEGSGLDKIGIANVSEISRDGLNQIGYLSFSRFDNSEAAKNFVNRVFSTFSDADGIIIDLRECGGGDAEMVKYLSNYFFDKPTHLLTSEFAKNTNGDREQAERWTNPNALSAIFAKKPLKILISEKTFSAAESFAYGMQVTNRAQIVGQTSGGGGYMNDFFELPSSLGVSVSVGRTFDPRTGKGWQIVGVKPDLVTEQGHGLYTALQSYTEVSGKLIALNDEQRAIYDQVQAYANAWYGADAAMMDKLLAANYQRFEPNLKRPLSGVQMIEKTRAGAGVRENKIYYNRQIRDIVTTDNEATVSLVLRETSHKLKLVKLNFPSEKWLITFDELKNKVRG